MRAQSERRGVSVVHTITNAIVHKLQHTPSVQDQASHNGKPVTRTSGMQRPPCILVDEYELCQPPLTSPLRLARQGTRQSRMHGKTAAYSIEKDLAWRTLTFFWAAERASELPYSEAYAPLTILSWAWWRPNTFSRASEISPTVQRARAACERKRKQKERAAGQRPSSVHANRTLSGSSTAQTRARGL